MSAIDASLLSTLQHHAAQIRNICILAHVDHGKTTLSDFLLSSNGVISRSLAGKVRFLDSRPDEQARGITMKSSSIALIYQKPNQLPDARAHSQSVFLINLIDSPGHVDFSSEVATAVRCSDGALVLVDVIEGLCVQTSAVLRQAWREGVRPVLVLNKIDRLISEVRMSAMEAYMHCFKLIESVNAMAATFITADAMDAVTVTADSGSVDIDDSKQLEFSPSKGNVIFASGYDGWAFTIDTFAHLYSQKLGMKFEALQQCLWGDFYYHPKEKKVTRKPNGKTAKPMFVALVLDVMWQVYGAVLEDSASVSDDALVTMMAKLGVSVTMKELARDRDRRKKLQSLMQKWLPLSNSVLGCVVDRLPSPIQAQAERIDRLWSGGSDSLAELHTALLRCDRHYPHVLVYVSKMVDVGDVIRQTLSRAHEPKLGIGIRKAYVKRQSSPSSAENDAGSEAAEAEADASTVDETKSEPVTHPTTSTCTAGRFLAFARVFAGTLSTTEPKDLHIYLPRYTPASTHHHLVVPASRLSLFLLMGVELSAVAAVPAGNVCGIGGLDDYVLKMATLSTLPPPLPPFQPPLFQSAPIVRVALEPETASEFRSLQQGLALLNHSDPNVSISESPSGETVLSVSGELHLERCLRDLSERFAPNVRLRVSEPLSAVRETIVRASETNCGNVTDFLAVKKERREQREKRKKKRGDEDSDEEASGSCNSSGGAAKDTGSPTTGTVAASVSSTADPIDRALSSSPASANCDVAESASVADSASTADTAGLLPKHPHEVEEWLPNKSGMISVRCLPLGQLIADTLAMARTAIAALRCDSDTEDKAGDTDASTSTASGDGGSVMDEDDILASRGVALYHPRSLLAKLRELFGSKECPELDSSDVDRVWSFGPNRVGPNLLINRTEFAAVTAITRTTGTASIAVTETDTASAIDTSRLALFQSLEHAIVAGFQIACASGPMCEEPLMGVCFIVERLALSAHVNTGSLITASRQACRKAFQSYTHCQRVVESVNRVELACDTEAVGALYGVVQRRRGSILSETLKEGTNTFLISALVPASETFGFASELRTKTGGEAQPQILFSHWAVLDVDPFFVARSEEALERQGTNEEGRNRAKEIVERIRKRKGLFVKDKVVAHAEKQRTLARKK